MENWKIIQKKKIIIIELHYKKKSYIDTNFSYQIKWLLIVIKIITKLNFDC